MKKQLVLCGKVLMASVRDKERSRVGSPGVEWPLLASCGSLNHTWIMLPCFLFCRRGLHNTYTAHQDIVRMKWHG
jgi:hypothetical protein